METLHATQLEMDEVQGKIQLLSHYDPAMGANFARLFDRLYRQEMQTKLHRDMLTLYLKDWVKDLDKAMEYAN